MKRLELYPVWHERENDFLALKNYFLNVLKPLNFRGAIAFGSAIRIEKSASGISDIDIVAYSDAFSRETAQIYIDCISDKGGDFLDKAPLFIEDFISDRVEFYLCLGQTVFDINIFPSKLRGYETRYSRATHDSLDLVIGAMYNEAGLLFGEIPFEGLIKEEFTPFYCDELRRARMAQLKERIILGIQKIRNVQNQDPGSALYQAYKTRGYLIKWIFIKARKYPVDLERYLDRQMSQQLQLTESTIDALLFNNKSLTEALENFVTEASQIINYE